MKIHFQPDRKQISFDGTRELVLQLHEKLQTRLLNLADELKQIDEPIVSLLEGPLKEHIDSALKSASARLIWTRDPDSASASEQAKETKKGPTKSSLHFFAPDHHQLERGFSMIIHPSYTLSILYQYLYFNIYLAFS